MIVFIEELLFARLQDDSECSWPICQYIFANYVASVLFILSLISSIR